MYERRDPPRSDTEADLALDRALIEAARTGDTAAYGTLVERYQDAAFRTAWIITRSAADAEEAAQDAFIKAYAALDRFRRDAPFRPWILGIAANEARNRVRSRVRRLRLLDRVVRETPTETVASPEHELVGGERREAVRVALARLPERDRTVIACRYFLELSEAETAAVLDCPTGTVKSRLSRALGRLRAELGDEA